MRERREEGGQAAAAGCAQAAGGYAPGTPSLEKEAPGARSAVD
eukprot:CAMPEP_0113702290 /NCGR_PEP_ID=MMETSP0038_2-20120614/25102_1 /TAXON_ID=2898 /ORGANISM="Cryptomonas paramecium" /LENGTH=42 /DNA_ID=CAMNT_0000626385 /DNA_START=190 /DNA_END=318 /DNA_ORIENTATION=+ /assembly_acc=CAM_ASM_000170